MGLSLRRSDRSASELLKERGIRRLVYFHSDHFEPWRLVPGRPADYKLALDDLRRYVRLTREREFGRCATLFFKNNVNVVVDGSRELLRAHPADRIGFIAPFGWAETLAGDMLDLLREDGRELQLHIHHENITWNDRLHDRAVREHLADPANRRFDGARFELLVRLNLDLMARHRVIDPQRWFFVHGHWALNASDPHECTLVREIEMLRRNGCLGDFTQPSGRPHTNSRIEEPYLARPVARAKGYDRPEAEPVAAAGAGAVPADRFLVWASRINHRFTSIDHYSGFVQERMKDPRVFARANAADGFAHDGVLYVKTHAHTMQPIYWQKDGCGPFPHAHPGIIGELGALFDAADDAGAEVEFASVSTVFERLMAAPPAPVANLVERYRLAAGDPMAEIGCDVRITGTAGEIAPPPLAPLPDRLPVATLCDEQDEGLPISWPIIDEVARALGHDEPPPPPLTAAVDAELDALAATLGEVAGRVLARLGGTGAVAGTIDLSAQASLVAAIEAAGLDPEAPLVEIGCGHGLLATLLAARGWNVVGIDGSTDRIATARAIADAAEARGLTLKPPRFEVARFPGWLPHRWPIATATAIVSGLTNPGGQSGQAAFIRGLAGFDRALVDLNRFYVVRTTDGERARLVELFARAGFAAPQLVDGGAAESRLAMFRQARGRRLFDWTGRVLRTLGLSKAA